MSVCEVNRLRLLRPELNFHRGREGGERSEGRNRWRLGQEKGKQYNTNQCNIITRTGNQSKNKSSMKREGGKIRERRQQEKDRQRK